MRSLSCYFVVLAFLFSISNTSFARQQVLFRVDMNGADAEAPVGIRGNFAPLSWEKTFPLSDPDGDGVYSGQVDFPALETSTLLEYKFVSGEVTWELETAGNRMLILEEGLMTLPVQQWNKAEPFSETVRERLTHFSGDDFREDLSVLRQALEALHPGLYRYNSPADIERHFEVLEQKITSGLDLRQAYAATSELLAKIRCGHTYANFWNQGPIVRQEVLERPDKLPFAFRIVDQRIWITQNASADNRFQRGTEVLAINGISTADILDRLKNLVKADGSNDAKRIYDLQVQGYGQYEAFDVYFPLLFPPENGAYRIKARAYNAKAPFDTQVQAVNRDARREALQQRYGNLPESYDDLWSFQVIDQKLACLRLGSFVTWNMEMDWKAFLKEAFRELDKQSVPNLVIDIRGNEGGADEVIAELARYLVSGPLQLEGQKTLLRYRSVPEALRPHLRTWDEAYFDLGKRVEPAGDGFYKWKGDDFSGRRLRGSKNAYKGKVFLLIDAANSSATFYLARMLKEHGLATLVGQKTGGSRRGINGGMMFMLTLPNTGIEVDIPLMATFPLTEEPDRGVLPDEEVQSTPEQIARGVDSELEAVRGLIGIKE